jgi:hypothetical protein
VTRRTNGLTSCGRTYIKMVMFFRYLLSFCEINIVNFIMASVNFEGKWHFRLRVKEIKVICSSGTYPPCTQRVYVTRKTIMLTL